LFSDLETGTFVHGTASFDVFCVKIGSDISIGCGALEEPQKEAE